MIEIDEPPDIQACAGCSRRLTWLYSYRLGVPVAFIVDPTNTRRLEVHGCEMLGHPAPTWRHVEPQDPETFHTGMDLARRTVRQALEAATKEIG